MDLLPFCAMPVGFFGMIGLMIHFWNLARRNSMRLKHIQSQQDNRTIQNLGLQTLIREGKINEAIHVYQQFTGVDQYVAKDAVEKLQRTLSEK